MGFIEESIEFNLEIEEIVLEEMVIDVINQIQQEINDLLEECNSAKCCVASNHRFGLRYFDIISFLHRNQFYKVSIAVIKTCKQITIFL